MSAIIYWDSVKPGKYLKSVNSATSFMEICSRVFGDIPLSLAEKDIPALRTLSALEDGDENPWQELLKQIEIYGEIKIWAEY